MSYFKVSHLVTTPFTCEFERTFLPFVLVWKPSSLISKTYSYGTQSGIIHAFTFAISSVVWCFLVSVKNTTQSLQLLVMSVGYYREGLASDRFNQMKQISSANGWHKSLSKHVVCSLPIFSLLSWHFVIKIQCKKGSELQMSTQLSTIIDSIVYSVNRVHHPHAKYVHEQIKCRIIHIFRTW